MAAAGPLTKAASHLDPEAVGLASGANLASHSVSSCEDPIFLVLLSDRAGRKIVSPEFRLLVRWRIPSRKVLIIKE